MFLSNARYRWLPVMMLNHFNSQKYNYDWILALQAQTHIKVHMVLFSAAKYN